MPPSVLQARGDVQAPGTGEGDWSPQNVQSLVDLPGADEDAAEAEAGADERPGTAVRTPGLGHKDA